MKLLVRIFVVVFVAATVMVGGSYAILRASLPQTDGQRAASGLSAPVSIDRDGSGVPTIRGRDRGDVAYALGFLHAQERFFQMDLLRRKAAGELAALFGSQALDYDRDIRRHRLRAVAHEVSARLEVGARALLEQYTRGVNEGLTSLGAKPFEYWLLSQAPQPWRVEDSALVTLAMFLELQDHKADRDRFLGNLGLCLPESAVRFLVPSGTEWDAALDDSQFDRAPLPAPADFNPRQLSDDGEVAALALMTSDVSPSGIGSNQWGVPGGMTDHGGALLAGDMHLKLGVPNIWYRARMLWDEGERASDIVGVTLPGVPSLVVGSNGHVAWTFTNGYLDHSDAVLLEESADGDAYRANGNWQPYATYDEVIEVRGAEPITLRVKMTRLGPRLDNDAIGRPWAVAWAGQFAAAIDPLALVAFETARSVDEVLIAAPALGIPVQNILVADAAGQLGWTVGGKMPAGNAQSGPLSFAQAAQRWQSWRDPANYPQVRADAEQPLWTANNRVMGERSYLELGDAGLALGARAQQIRDRLASRDVFDVDAMLAIQLDDEARFLAHWRELLLTVLDEPAQRGNPARQEMRRLVEQWRGRADVEDVGYRLVRAFRIFLAEEAFGFLFASCRTLDKSLPYQRFVQWEAPLWAMVTARPEHLLNPKFVSWSAQFDAALTRVETYFSDKHLALNDATWGDFNRLNMSHPLSGALPLLSRWLDMPNTSLPGDDHMPRVQGPGFGASQRMVVAPGREEEGIFQMPGGQSGHPLSPFYRYGHDDWVTGRAAPLLPQDTRHTLRLEPLIE